MVVLVLVVLVVAVVLVWATLRACRALRANALSDGWCATAQPNNLRTHPRTQQQILHHHVATTYEDNWLGTEEF